MGCGATERDFQFWVPMEVIKSEKGDMRIGGIATDENSEDLQGETVLLRGLDVSYLQKRGTWNWDHQKDPGSILGEVDIVQKNLDDGTLYVEGTLYPQVEKALEVYNLMKGMEKSGSNRKLGMSLEGKVKERDGANGKIIKSAWIKNIALTYHPINQNTFVDFIKSLGDQPTYEPCTCECGTNECPFAKSGCGAPGEGGSGTTAGMYAGADNPSSSGGVSGSALRKESLEKDEKVTTYTEKDLKKKKKTNGEITKSDLEEKLMEEKGYSPEVANRMSNLLFDVAKSKRTLNKTDVINLLKSKKGYSEEAAVRMTDILFSLVKGNVQIPGHTRKYKSGKITQVKPFSQTRSLKAKLAEAKKEGKPTEKIEAEIKKVEGEKAPEKKEGVSGDEKAKYDALKEMASLNLLNDHGKEQLAKLEEKFGEGGESKHLKTLQEKYNAKPEELEWLKKYPGLAEHIVKFGESEEAEKAKESPKKEVKKPGVAEVEKVEKEGAKADKAHQEAEEAPETKASKAKKIAEGAGKVVTPTKGKYAPKEEPVSMEMKGQEKPPEEKVGAETKGEAEWEVSESKAGGHAKEFYSSGGKLMSDKYHAIAQNYPNATPEESQRMIEVLKYGLSQYKEMYVEKKDWGEKSSDPKWLQTNKLVGAEEGKRRAIMKRAEGHPAGSKDQRQDYRISLNIQERIPKLVLGV